MLQSFRNWNRRKVLDIVGNLGWGPNINRLEILFWKFVLCTSASHFVKYSYFHVRNVFVHVHITLFEIHWNFITLHRFWHQHWSDRCEIPDESEQIWSTVQFERVRGCAQNRRNSLTIVETPRTWQVSHREAGQFDVYTKLRFFTGIPNLEPSTRSRQ